MSESNEEMGSYGVDTSSGLPDNFDGTVIAAEFTVDERYKNEDGSLPTVLRLEFDHAAAVEPVIISLGKGWEIGDGGKTVSHPTNTQFNARSHYGMMITRCVSADADKGGLGMLKLLQGRGESTQADIWVGLSFHWEREEVDYGKDIGAKEKLMPTKFLGEAGAGGAAGGAEAAPEADAGGSEGEGPLSGIDGKTRLALKKVAKVSDDAAAFQEAAMEIDGLPDSVMNDVLDDEKVAAIYEALK